MKVALLSQGVALGFAILPFQGNFSVNLSRSLSLCSVVVLKSSENLAAYRKSNMLPRELLHPIIGEKIWATFLRGDYDTSIFQCYKEVEIRVREAGGFQPEDIGVDLMRKAFHITNGPLTDTSLPKSEREAIAHLFAGAIGSYKNPHSHRRVEIKADEAVEMIMLASHLLSIVDAIEERRSAQP